MCSAHHVVQSAGNSCWLVERGFNVANKALNVKTTVLLRPTDFEAPSSYFVHYIASITWCRLSVTLLNIVWNICIVGAGLQN
jgi:hypothetical protein